MEARFSPVAEWYRRGYLSQYLLLIACVAGAIGLLATARALVALAPVAAVVAALLNPQLRQAAAQWLRNGAAQRAAALYLLIPLTWWYTSDWPVWRHEVYRQLPLIGVPLAFALAVPLSSRQRFGLGVGFVSGTALLGLATLARYLADPAWAQTLIGTSQNVPSVTGIFHIYFGIMLALSAYWAVSLSTERRAGRLGRWLLLGVAAAAALSLHVLVYRTGLLAFYAALFASGLLLLFRRPVVALVLLVVGVGLAASAYVSLPSVQKRVGATLYDINEYNAGRDINQLSIGRRLAALHNAQVLVAEHPWLGVAPADVRQAMDEQFSWQTYGLAQENRVMIHNQYVHYLVGAGVVGLLLWLWVLIMPLVQPGLRQNPYVRAYLLIFAAAALADSLLEMQIGFNLFVFLYGFLVVAADRRRQTSRVTR